MRWIGLAFVVVLLLIGWLAFANPTLFPAGVGDRLPQLIYLVMALLLVAGAAFGFPRLRHDSGRAIPSLLIWAGVIVLIVLLYNIFGQR